MLIKCKTAQYPRNRWCICRRWGALNATSALCVSPLLSACPPPGSGRASIDLLLTSFHLSFSKTRKNNLLPAVDVQTLLLRVRKLLPPRGAFGDSLPVGLAQPAPAPCPMSLCPAVPHCCLCLAWLGWPVLQPQGPCWGAAGCSVPMLLLGSSPTGDMGGAETQCPSLVAEERQQLLLPMDEALRGGCQEDWGERPGLSQLKTLSAVRKW